MSLSSSSGSVSRGGSSLKINATLTGLSQSVKLTDVVTPSAGIKVIYQVNTSDSPTGVVDGITISATTSAARGPHTISFTATGADGQKSTKTFKLTVS